MYLFTLLGKQLQLVPMVPDPHQSFKLDPGPHQFSDDKMYGRILSLCVETRIQIEIRTCITVQGRIRIRIPIK